MVFPTQRINELVDGLYEDIEATSEKPGRAGLAELEDQSLQSTLRRGWYWGSQEFRERLLDAFGDSATQRKNRDDRSSPMLKDHAEAGAERIIAMACEHFGTEPEELKKPVRGDQRRAAVAWAISRRTTQPHAWVAERLNLCSRANVSQAVWRFESKPDRELTKQVREWKLLNVVDCPLFIHCHWCVWGFDIFSRLSSV